MRQRGHGAYLLFMSMPDLWFHRASPSAVLVVAGEDAPRFLQGQGSADLSGPEGSCRYTLWLDHRGRVQGDSYVLRTGEEAFLLVSTGTPAPALRARFDSFIVADDVEIDQRAGKILFTLGGAGMAPALNRAGVRLPDAGSFSTGECAVEDAGFPPEAFFFRMARGASDSVECLVDAAAADAFAEWLARAGADERPFSDLEALRIAARIPAVPRDIGPGETPFDGGLGDFVCLTKGCFLGQEVAARQARLGRWPKLLVGVEGSVKVDTEEAYPVFAEGKEVGELRSSVYRGFGLSGLALVKRSASGGEAALYLSAEGGEPLRVLGGDGKST